MRLPMYKAERLDKQGETIGYISKMYNTYCIRTLKFEEFHIDPNTIEISFDDGVWNSLDFANSELSQNTGNNVIDGMRIKRNIKFLKDKMKKLKGQYND